MNRALLLAAIPALALAAAAPQAQAGGCRIGRDIGHGLGIGLGVGVGIAVVDSVAHRRCSPVYTSPCYAPRYRPPAPCVVERPVYIDRPVYVERSRPIYVEPAPVVVERPVYVDRPVVTERIVEKPVYVDRVVERPVVTERVVERPVERPVYVDRTVVVENGRTTTFEKVDGTLKSIVHAPSEPRVLGADAEMALLCSIRDEINRQLPLEVARVTKDAGGRNQVEVVLRATRFSPYDRATRRFVVNAQQLTAVGNGVTIRFNADQAGLAELAGDFREQLLRMGAECQAQGGEWYLDDKFQADPVRENARPLKEALALITTASK